MHRKHLKILIVVDMQNDFVTMALGTPEARLIVKDVVNKINEYRAAGYIIIFTQDTHFNYYMETLEGKKLPIPHCILGTLGWHIIADIDLKRDDIRVNKETFGYIDWKDILHDWMDIVDEIELCGLCTDICVISNALILRALYPYMPITVDAKCCAGVTPEKHKAALEVMKSCQIDVINE